MSHLCVACTVLTLCVPRPVPLPDCRGQRRAGNDQQYCLFRCDFVGSATNLPCVHTSSRRCACAVLIAEGNKCTHIVMHVNSGTLPVGSGLPLQTPEHSVICGMSELVHYAVKAPSSLCCPMLMLQFADTLANVAAHMYCTCLCLFMPLTAQSPLVLIKRAQMDGRPGHGV